jgi:phosphatidylglycerophosphatase A
MSINKKEIRNKAKVFNNFNHFLAFGFGSGLSPVAPGTMGTLAAIPVYLLMVSLLPQWLYIFLTIVFFIAGIQICNRVSTDLQTHDFSGIVWDEIVGYLITMMFLPLSWELIILGFVLFRFFDILKPWPINWLDKHISGGMGIMLDDVLAGLFSWVILLFVSHYWLSMPLFST